ncbi:MAG: PLxRFG domain-containing protein [Alphaproteobacteria bacterium]|nr:PLxRFG domain-containing protein [Alphaproteobacteria bacterium]
MVDRLFDPGGKPANAAYLRGVVQVAMTAGDPMNALRHEAIHALRDLNLIRPEEWRRLDTKAKSQWLAEHRIAERYPHLSREAQHEEAVAEAFADHTVTPLPAGFRSIWENIRRFFERLGASLRGQGFQTVEDVFGRVESGEVGARGRVEVALGEGRAEAAYQVSGSPRTGDEAAPADDTDLAADADALADLLARRASDQAAAAANPAQRLLSVAGGHLPPVTPADATAAPRLPYTPDLNFLAKMVVHPRSIAMTPSWRGFAPVYEAAVEMFETRDRTVSELARIVEPYGRLSAEEKRHVNVVLEIGRLKGEVYAGRTIGATNTVRTTGLSRFRDHITLTEAEREGYLAIRATMDRALDLFREHLLRQWGYGKPGDPSTAADFKALVDEQGKSPAENAQLERFAQVLQEIEDARRTGYVPFSRFGQIGLTVRDQLNSVVHFEKIDTDRFVGATVGRRLHREAVAERRRELMRQYPATDGYRVSQPIELRGPFSLSNAGVQLSDVDALAELGGADPSAYEMVRKALEEGIRKAGFRSHFFSAKQTAGYSPDFERSIADYITGLAGYIARRQAEEPIQGAIGALAAAGRQPNLTNYARRYAEYVMEPLREWQTARQLTFIYYLTSPATGMVNLSQVPLFTAPYLSGLTNPARVGAEIARAYADAAEMLSAAKMNPERGIEAFDPDKAPTDIRDEVRRAFDEGYLVPQMTYEQMATATGSSPRIRGLSKNARTAMDALASFYTITERTNRLVTFIATLRLAKADQDMLAKLDQQQAENPLYGLQVGTATPEAAARWITDETQFKVGKVNRPEAMRGIGAWLLQFKSFIMHALELQYRQLRQYHGNGAKTALALNVAGLLVMTGLFGFPGADDLKELAEAIYKKFAKQDIDIEREVREFIYEMTGAAWLAEAGARGVGRQTGVDFAKRIGMGDLVPNLSENPLTWSVAFDLVVGRINRAIEHLQRGDHLNAVAETLPALIANPVKALGMLESGVRSQKTGRVILPPEKIGAADIAARAIGFTSSNIARRREAEYAETRAKRSTAELRTEWYTQLARALAAKARAERAKDADASIAAVQRFRSTIEEIKRHNATAAPQDRFSPSRDNLVKLFRAEMEGAEGKKVPKRMQGERERIREVYGVAQP